MKKLVALFLVLTLSATLFAGCSTTSTGDTSTGDTSTGDTSTEDTNTGDSSTSDTGKTGEKILNWNSGADPKTLDPGLNGASDAGHIINQTFEGLIREKSGELVPGLAESWEVSEDGLTVTFHLRESKWSDGTPLTAHDFVYSWKRGMDPATASEYAWIWEYTNIIGAAEAAAGVGSLDDVAVRAEDDLTLVAELKSPTDYIIGLLAFYHFLPVNQKAVEGKAEGAWAKDAELAISNGPYVLTSYTIAEGATFKKNEHYWNADAVGYDGMKVVFIDDHSTSYQGYESGELVAIPEVPTSETARLIAEDPNFYVWPLLGTYYYNFNLEREVWEDPRVRRALTLAIDREMIVETLSAGQIPATSFVPTGFLDHEGNDFSEKAGSYGIPTDGSGVEEAQQLLAEAGYPGGEGFPEFKILYNTGDGHQKVAELVQEMYKVNLGINVQLQNQEWAVFQDTRKQGDYEMARGGWLTDFMDPMGLLGIFTQGNAYNDPKYANDEFDALLAEANATRGAEHFEALYKAQDIFMSELPVVPIYYYSDKWLISDKVEGWDRSVLGTIDFSTARPAE